ncbi:PIN/TRAM domain-containing protein [Fimbriiglobus ruber]|uniref:Membrane-associated protein containing RNA-binding TRAM domain and ribonuclease PIN-domain n=1 Tax=Fimbriiglobus ruber TaxID=1908690 RepID=A0A225E6J7_9BACT|nr:PIN domain-containing protein [Fimbriiglobus ruber]OWK45119.1 Membrane-associated protein containing RNA-binding TRAM domain and ribonuclease PIN-domain [Fimbriiglobus ruber]
MLMWLLRGFFATLLVAIAAFAYSFFHSEDPLAGVATAAAIVAIGGFVLFTDVKERNKQIGTISAVYFGLLLGLLLGWLFSLALGPIIEAAYTGSPERVNQLNTIWRFVLTLACCYISISTLLQTKDDFRFIIPYVEFSKQVKGERPMVLDTSVIIDGRIADLCDTRVVDTKLIVPRFVLQELQAIADSSDKLKRNRGRRGLDILKRLQSNTKIELLMHDGNVGEIRPGEKIRVDERLVLFTKAINGRVVTNDFNLNKIAQLQGVDVINLNEVANSLKTVALPGEYLQVKVVKAGDQIGQGVGYLDDGTMVVIEQGRHLIGQDTSLLVTSVLQTPAGRMIFGRPEGRPSGTFNPVPGPSSGTHSPVTAGGGAQSGTHPPFAPEKSGPQQPLRGPDGAKP